MTIQIEKWDCFEHTLIHESASNPFIDVNLEATFTHENQQVNVSGFYDGAGIFKVRFMPDREGSWKFVTRSNVPGLDAQHGEFVCIPSSAGNHGPVRVAEQTRFAYEDGTPYIPVGTTCYVWNLQGDELEEETLKTLEQAPFNKMRMCVFPKRFPFNQNEPPSYPFAGEIGSWDVSQFNPAYFQHLEKRILDLRDRGIEADLIVFHPYDNSAWGFDRLPAEVNDRYLHYLVARLAAFRNLWWSFANEFDVLFDRTMSDWGHYMQLVQTADPYNHLRSIHNLGEFYDHSKPWVTHCSIQDEGTEKTAQWLKRYQKPVIFDECGYEGNIQYAWGDLSPEELVARFWRGFTQGGYVGHGETYLNDAEILWWSKGGQLHGQSVPRIAFLRQIFEPAPYLTPTGVIERQNINLFDPEMRARLMGKRNADEDVIAAALAWGGPCVYNTDKGYYLTYLDAHQPASRQFDFPAGSSYQIDVIDTWNMTIETVTTAAVGATRVPLPGRKFMAIRIQRN
jgi:hypothetical protein